MKFNITILPEAELDIDDAYIWYESKQIGLGKKFYSLIDKSVQFISARPYSCTEIYTLLKNSPTEYIRK